MSANITGLPVADSNTCRLCRLYCGGGNGCINEENAQMEEVYKITVKYFPTKFLEPNWGSRTSALCLECWRHIIEFHSFQESIFETQKNLLGRQPVVDVEMQDMASLPENNADVKPKFECLTDKEIKMETTTTSQSTENVGNNHVNVKEELVVSSVLNDELSIDFSLSDLEDLDILFSSDDEIHESNSLNKVKNKNPLQSSIKTATQSNASQKSQATGGKQKPTDPYKAKLECWICNKPVETFKLLRKHFSLKHHIDQCYIKCCQIKFTSGIKLEEHARLKHSEQATYGEHTSIDPHKAKLECWICEETVKNFTLLQKHFSLKHNIEQCYIKCCQIKITTEIQFEDHAHLMHSEQAISGEETSTDPHKAKLECWICNKPVETFTHLQMHFNLKHYIDQCYIKCCQIKFTTGKQFEEHVRLTHSDKKGFIGELCKDEYPNASILKKHQFQKNPAIVHKYICPECPLIFTTEEQLENHYKTHFVCQQCKKVFQNTDELNNHIQSIHTCSKKSTQPQADKKTFACENCDKRFLNADILKSHISSVHTTSKETSTIKPYICKQCGKTFESTTTIKNHQRYGHNRTFQNTCKVCEKGFRNPIDRRDHMNCHTKYNFYVCPLCSEKCQYWNQMISHIKEKHGKKYSKDYIHQLMLVEKARAIRLPKTKVVKNPPNKTNGDSKKTATYETVKGDKKEVSGKHKKSLQL